MLKLKEEENVFITEIKKARQEGKKVYILGAALGAVRIAGGLQYYNLDFDAFVVDQEYFRQGQKLLDKEILCIDDISEKDSVLIRSIANYPHKEKLRKKYYVIDEDVLSLSMVASDPFDLEYAKKEYKRLNKFFESLQDEKSREVMTSYINQKITGRFSEMEGIWEKINSQFFGVDFYDITKVNCMVDCGAYYGDTFLSFCDEYEKRAHDKYRGIAYLLDPDSENQKAIKENCKECVADIRGLQIGVWDEKKRLSFRSDKNFRDAGMITDHGDIFIDVDTIDDVVGDNTVGLIKMCVEGASLNALKGAERTIKRDHPVLAIGAYHKRQDILELSDYITAICPNYKFYLRAYGGPYSIYLILYAVI